MFTILGASGFLGSHIGERVREEGYDCYCPNRGEILQDVNLGHVIYCIGLTADFRTRPMETVEAHVCHLMTVLQRCRFESFMYLSSTRVYPPGGFVAHEESPVKVNPLVPGDLYNISKLMGESICFASRKKNIRVVRLSNVYGYDAKSENFLFALIRDALGKRKVVLETSPCSNKDHISIKDVVDVLPKIATAGKHNIYNVASGKNTSVGQITTELKKLTGCEVVTNNGARIIGFPRISIVRVREEFGFSPTSIQDNMKSLVGEFRKRESK